MDNSLSEKYLPVLQKHWLPIGLGLFGLIFLGYGLIVLAGGSSKDEDIVFEQGSFVNTQDDKATESKKITVDIEGAVVKPGVYSLAYDARVQDALIAAGGMSDKADREKVSKGLNLASKLIDGGKIYIPFIGDSTVGFGTGGGGDPSAGSGQAILGSSSNLININTASASELDKLQGVGPVTAEKIISNRPYSAIEELVSKKAVSQKVFENIKEKIGVY